MIEYLHGDENDKPYRGRLLEELIIVDTDIEFPDLSRDIQLQKGGQKGSGVDHWQPLVTGLELDRTRDWCVRKMIGA